MNSDCDKHVKTGNILRRKTMRQRLGRIFIWLMVGVFALLSATWRPYFEYAPWQDSGLFYGCPSPERTDDLAANIWWLE